MRIISKLASSLNRRDEIPNQELAKQIVAKKDAKAIQELVENLDNKSKAIQNDCIKVLYEIGESNPALIAEYADNFIALLDNKNNRLQWGAMTAIHTITGERPKTIHAALPEIMDAAEKGSVITKDNAVNILIKLGATKEYADNAFSLLCEILVTCPTNQLPMYVERAIPIINDSNKVQFIKVLKSRLPEIEKDSKRIRIEKVIKKISSP